ncbi:glycosyltransferase family 4 protein [Tepidicaulis sp. LMO-SS28]|uniref:glycosyltransferase family 4 protein n=1 Tax=Tepidicaulis sp. LMO-SS28 TaxID=3447455 RepID=UPI003EDED991
MNIWIVNHFAVPPGQSGGTRHWVLSQYLKKAGHDVSIIASNVNYQSRKTFSPGERYRARIQDCDGVRFLWLNVPAYQRLLSRVLSMFVFLFRAAFGRSVSQLPRPDVIIGSTPHPFAAYAGYRLSKRYRVPFVLEVRDIWPESLIELGSYSRYHPFIFLIDRLEKLLLRKAKKVITLLPNAADELVAKGARREAIIWIPNGVNISGFEAQPAAGDDGIFDLIYAGAHGVANGLDVAVEAAKILQDRGNASIHFTFVGDGSRKAALIQRARELDLNNIEFRDSVSKNEIPAVLASADACFMHLRDLPVFRWGVSPNKLFDYMAAARPVIFAVNTSENPIDIADAGVSIPPDNAQALADAVVELAALSPAEREGQGRRGREYVVENHSDRVLGERLLGLIESLSGMGAD